MNLATLSAISLAMQEMGDREVEAAWQEAACLLLPEELH